MKKIDATAACRPEIDFVGENVVIETITDMACVKDRKSVV